MKQRNAAREEALLASQNLKKLEEDIEAGALQPAAPAAAAAQQPLAVTPPATAAGSPMGADSGASAPGFMTEPASKPRTLNAPLDSDYYPRDLPLRSAP